MSEEEWRMNGIKVQSMCGARGPESSFLPPLYITALRCTMRHTPKLDLSPSLDLECHVLSVRRTTVAAMCPSGRNRCGSIFESGATARHAQMKEEGDCEGEIMEFKTIAAVAGKMCYL